MTRNRVKNGDINKNKKNIRSENIEQKSKKQEIRNSTTIKSSDAGKDVPYVQISLKPNDRYKAHFVPKAKPAIRFTCICKKVYPCLLTLEKHFLDVHATQPLVKVLSHHQPK